MKKGFEESMEVCDKTVPVILIGVFENVIKGSESMLSKLTPPKHCTLWKAIFTKVVTISSEGSKKGFSAHCTVQCLCRLQCLKAVF